MSSETKCSECGEPTEDNDMEICTECCDHDDVCRDERCCLICGKDMSEDLMASAYDYYKDRMKYGDD